MDKGIYCLVFKNPACTTRVGSLGEVPFRAGYHIYIGSALGSGGLKRLARHLTLARERDKCPKWHVDHLITDPRFSLAYAVSAPTHECLECQLADSLGGSGVTGFGASDCRCASHLLFRRRDPEREIMTAFRSLGLVPTIKTILSP